MSYRIVLRPKAERAIDRAAAWYHKDNPRAAKAFLLAVDACIRRIADDPAHFPIVRNELRRAIVTGFPYSLLFRMTDSEVVITTCVHFSRHPRHWR
jgi:plasmid stabilization system protein ParE